MRRNKLLWKAYKASTCIKKEPLSNVQKRKKNLQIFKVNSNSLHKWQKYTQRVGKKDELRYLAIPSRLFFTVPPAIEKYLLKRIIDTKYLTILMTNLLSIPILCRTIADSRIDTLWRPTITIHPNAIYSDNTSHLLSKPGTLSTTSHRHEACTDRWTYKHGLLFDS